jgi:hypothetical protein
VIEEFGSGAVGADPIAPTEQVVNFLCFPHFGLRASGQNERIIASNMKTKLKMFAVALMTALQ